MPAKTRNSNANGPRKPVDASPSRGPSEGPWAARARQESRFRGETVPEHGPWIDRHLNPPPTVAAWQPDPQPAPPTPVLPKVTPLRPNWALLEVPVHPSPEILRLCDEGPEGGSR
jgi:hypothetical protein